MNDATDGAGDVVVRIPPHVVFRAVGERTVLLNIQTCRYHGLNATGGRMLEVLAARGQVADAVATLASEFDAPSDVIARDLSALMDQLEHHGLIEIHR